MELPDELVGIEDELDIDEQPEPDVPFEDAEDRDDEDADDVEREQFVMVAVGEETFALHVNAVRRLVDVDHQTRVPRTSEAIDGITDLRGSITAVIDPRELFDVPERDGPVLTEELVVFATGEEEGGAGIRVDEVEGVEAVPVTHVVLEPDDVGEDRELVAELLSNPLIAGLVRKETAEGGREYRPVVDTDAVLETAGEAAA